MKVDYINMYCDGCSNYVTLTADKVKVTLDLKEDRILYEAICPVCKKEVFNSRVAR